MGSSERRNYSHFFSQFPASNDSNGSSLNHGLLQNSNLNHTHNQDHGLSPIFPLQIPKENPVGSNILNSFQPKHLSLRISAIERFASSSNSVNLLQNSIGNLTGSENLSNSEPGKSLLQNSAKGLYAGSDIRNQLQTRAENRWGSLILNSIAPIQFYAGSDSANHFSSSSQLLSNKATESLWGPNIPKKLLSEQLLEKPIENPGQFLPYNVTENLSGLNIPKRLPSELLLEKPIENPNQLLSTHVTQNLSGPNISKRLLSERFLEKRIENSGQLLPYNVTKNFSGANIPKRLPSERLLEKTVENPSQLLPTNVTENLPGRNISKQLPSEQLQERPIENPKEVNPRTQTISEAIHKIVPEKYDCALSFVYQEGLRYCAKAKKTEKISSNTNSMSGQLMVEASSKEMDQRAKGSLKIIELLKQNLPKSRRKRRKSGKNINQAEKKLQVGSSSTPGDKEEINLTYNNATPSLLAAALINRSDQNRSGSPITNSVSPPTITRANGDPIRSRARTFPVKLHGEIDHESSSNNGLNSIMEYGGILSGAHLYHGASRLSSANSALDSNSNWQTIPSRNNPEAETQKGKNNLVGSSNVKGIGDQQFSSFFSGLNSQSFQTSPSSLSAPKKETAKHVPLSPIPIEARALNSTSQSQINGSDKNQQIEQLMSVVQAPTQQSTERIFTKQVPQQNSKLIEATVTFHRGESQTKEHALENLGTKIETSNRASLKLGEKEFERMVNWPEHHLMGTDRFGFDV